MAGRASDPGLDPHRGFYLEKRGRKDREKWIGASDA